MIYAQLSVFQMYSAYVTAEDERGFRDVFRNVVEACVQQYEAEFGEIGSKRKDRIRTDMSNFEPLPVSVLEGFVYDLRVDGNSYCGTLTVDQVFLSRDAVHEQFDEIVEDLNQGLADEDSRWTVFGGGFFPTEQGYEIDELFK